MKFGNSRPNLRNFFYLVTSGLIIQLAGSVYRIWLANRIGAEGLGILQMVYPVYRLLSGLATLGLPLALTKWSAEYLAAHQYSEIESVLKWAIRTVTVSSLIAGVGLFLCSPLLGRYLFTDGRVTEALYMIALAIPFSALSAIYRGHFQGHSQMAPMATSEITEQTVEIGTTFLFIGFLLNQMPFAASSAPVLGLTFGEVTCLITLFYFRKKTSKGSPNLIASQTNPLPVPALPRREIFQYSWPILLNQIVSSVSMASEGIIIPRLLMAGGISATVGTGLFGQLTGMAEPVSYFPLILLAPLASVLSPQVSSAIKTGALLPNPENKVQNDTAPIGARFRSKAGRYRSLTLGGTSSLLARLGLIKHKIRLFYTVAIILCLVCFLGIMTLAGPISRLLYRTMAAAPLIQLLVIGLPFTGVAILNISILGAAGATDKILMISIWATGLKAFCFVILIPLLGIVGAAWSINVTQIFLSLASTFELRRKSSVPAA
ncbi:MAG TPA: oligosaccharide flippase family protein [Bacillota bacterium]|nr:oligosaccharide flippase family protein [Bacillota bacterium]